MALLGIYHNILKEANGRSPVQRIRYPRSETLAGYDLNVTLAELCGFDYTVSYPTVALRLEVHVDIVIGDERHRWNPNTNLEQAREALRRLGNAPVGQSLQSMHDALRAIIASRVGETIAVPYLDEPEL